MPILKHKYKPKDTMPPPLVLPSINTAVNQVLDRTPGDIVLAIPLGIGKPNPFVNALYQRIKAEPARRLKIITALSLERPVGHSELEQNFLAPLVERVFADYPDLDYVKDLRDKGLPPNISVSEFFMKTGDYLGNPQAQQSYISANYTHVVRDMMAQGVNVLAHAIASKANDSGGLRLSLSSNPDLTLEVMEKYRATGKPITAVGVVNQNMPFMLNSAEVGADFFDIVVTDSASTHTVFAPPNNKISLGDYAIGLHASSLVLDGGTLQIGIGSLGDAISQALILRDSHNADYRRMLDALCVDGSAGRELDRFGQGLYGCSEMFVNGFLQLMKVGIVRREVFNDLALQILLNEGAIAGTDVTPQTLRALVDSGRLNLPLSVVDLHFLQKYGVVDANVTLKDGWLTLGAHRFSANLLQQDAFDGVCQHMLGTQLRGGIAMTGGFFLGPTDFYETLRTMSSQALAKIDMTRIDFINQLYGQEELKRAQRIHARFMNTTMLVTLLGAASSDALESGQVVSGVGGQYNFVAMAHALPDARLVMTLRATHNNKAGLTSGIVWSYGNVTIPRHLRDIVITEYGVADLRGQTDGEVVQRLIAVADSRFQDDLVAQAKANGKLDAQYQVPERYRNNLPQALAATLHPWAETGHLPDFPFGTDLTPDELSMVGALKKLQHASEHPAELLSLAFKSLWDSKEMPATYQARLGLSDAYSLKDSVLRRLLAGNL